MIKRARYKLFFEWQKAILIFSTAISVLFLGISLILPPLFGHLFDGFTPLAGLKLVLSGWVGLIVIGTVINAVSTLIGISADAIKK